VGTLEELPYVLLPDSPNWSGSNAHYYVSRSITDVMGAIDDARDTLPNAIRAGILVWDWESELWNGDEEANSIPLYS
jgi:hypothetical protein